MSRLLALFVALIFAGVAGAAQLTPPTNPGIPPDDGSKVLKLTRSMPAVQVVDETSLTGSNQVELSQDGSFSGAYWWVEVTGASCLVQTAIVLKLTSPQGGADEYKAVTLQNVQTSDDGFGILQYGQDGFGLDAGRVDAVWEFPLPIVFRFNLNVISGTCDTVELWLYGLR